MDQTDIDDDQLNALLFTDSEDEKPPKPAPVSRQGANAKSAPVRKASAGSRRSSSSGDDEIQKPKDAPKPANGVSALDEDLFASLAGPKVVKPINPVTDTKPVRRTKKKKKVVREAPSKAVAEQRRPSASSSRDEALRILAQEEEAERSLHMLLDQSDKNEQNPVPVPVSNPKAAVSDFSSDDDFLDGLDDKPTPMPDRPSSSSSGTATSKIQSSAIVPNSEVTNNKPMAALSIHQPALRNNASNSVEAETEYVPTTNSVQRTLPLSARSGRRARSSIASKIEDSNLKSTQADPMAEVSRPMSEQIVQAQSAIRSIISPVSLSEPLSRPFTASVPAPSELSTQAASAISAQPSPSTNSAALAQVVSEPSMNGSPAASFLQSSSLWDSMKPARSDAEPAIQVRNTIASQIQDAAMANQIAQLQSDLSRAKRTIKEQESEVEGLKVQLKAVAADYQEQLLAHTKATSERDIQVRIEEERKMKAAIEHINLINQASNATKERLHQEAIESLKRMHEMELAAVKRQHSDEHKVISMSEAVSRSAVTVEGIQREVREEIARADQQRRADNDAREKMLIEREGKFQEEIKRHTNVIATFESLRREHDTERMRLHEEEVRLQALQEFLMSESCSLKAQIANERAALQEEKRTFNRSVKDWKMQVAADQAEIAFLRDKAQAKVTEAQAAESAGQRAFAQAHQMVISEGEIVRRDREIAAKLRSEMEQEKQRMDQTTATLIEQRRQLSARMANVQKLGEKIRAQSETVAMAYRQAQTDIAESKRLKHEAEQERLKVQSERAKIEELRTFVEEERRRMESDRLEVVRQRQKVILERRDPKSFNSIKAHDSTDFKSQQSNNENRLLKPILPSSTRIEKEVRPEKSESYNLSADQERELFHLRMKAKVVADYATNEKKIIRPVL